MNHTVRKRIFQSLGTNRKSQGCRNECIHGNKGSNFPPIPHYGIFLSGDYCLRLTLTVNNASAVMLKDKDGLAVE